MAQWRCIKESRLAGETSIVSAFHPPRRPPSGTRTRERAQSYIVAKKYILEKERNGERERKSGLRELLGVAQHPEISTSNYERDFLMTIRALSINSK